ncbi:hypothetical protein LCGC14_1817920 [marine sediment metagenome]|uniref:Uncharacterized protein n=1 Tax=marine sediment metagenome TaxID=412755 RepID=A0A0F9JJB3_9ZZZZ
MRRYLTRSEQAFGEFLVGTFLFLLGLAAAVGYTAGGLWLGMVLFNDPNPGLLLAWGIPLGILVFCGGISLILTMWEDVVHWFQLHYPPPVLHPCEHGYEKNPCFDCFCDTLRQDQEA